MLSERIISQSKSIEIQLPDLYFIMSEIKPLTLVSGYSFGVLISEHPKNKCQSNHTRQQAIFCSC
ncbi:MAG: hypothetical protein AABX54_03820, partial [Nanoarchaeota archaeon]